MVCGPQPIRYHVRQALQRVTVSETRMGQPRYTKFMTLPRVGELHGQLTRRQLAFLQGELLDLPANRLGNSVPDPRWPGATILKRLGPFGQIPVIPAIKRGSGDAELIQRAPGRKMRSFDQADDLKLFRCGIPHSSSPPSAIMLFLSNRNSRACSATTSFRSRASRRRSLTSLDVAARAASPARRFFPASRNSLDQL